MIIRPEAEADMAEARDWYDRQRAGLGTEFIACVDDVFERITKTPRMHPEIYRHVRRAITRRFPYAVYYRLEGEEIVVLGVVHMHRDERAWRSRA